MKKTPKLDRVGREKMLAELVSQYHAVRKNKAFKGDPRAEMLAVHVGAVLLQAANTAALEDMLTNHGHEVVEETGEVVDAEESNEVAASGETPTTGTTVPQQHPLTEAEATELEKGDDVQRKEKRERNPRQKKKVTKKKLRRRSRARRRR